jgi:hypothetical protein
VAAPAKIRSCPVFEETFNRPWPLVEASYCQKLWIWRDRATKAIDGMKGESVSSG